MARKECPYCDDRGMITIANTNIQTHCEFCINGKIPRPKNFDITKEPPGLIDRIVNFFNNGESET